MLVWEDFQTSSSGMLWVHVGGNNKNFLRNTHDHTKAHDKQVIARRRQGRSLNQGIPNSPYRNHGHHLGGKIFLERAL